MIRKKKNRTTEKDVDYCTHCFICFFSFVTLTGTDIVFSPPHRRILSINELRPSIWKKSSEFQLNIYRKLQICLI